MPKNDLKINKDKELGGEELRSIAQKYVKWMSSRPSKRLWEMRSAEDVTGATNPDYVEAKKAYEQASARVPRSQQSELEEMQKALWAAKMKGLRDRGGAGRSGMSPTRGDM
jgi:hypothetical protein